MNIDGIAIRTQEAGRFDRRLHVGPAVWPYNDLMWIHEGSVRLQIGEASQVVDLIAPMGILILPNTPFRGAATSSFAAASICHFEGGIGQDTQGFLQPNPQDALHVQNLIRLSLSYARRGVDMAMRERLLRVIIDCFGPHQEQTAATGRVSDAWARAQMRLDRIRGLADVAAGIGLSESAFRSLHRNTIGASDGSSAGKYLQEMRLSTAERLLATTGATVAEIARDVGYAYAESFGSAFHKSRGQTPAVYRRWCKRFA